MSELLKLLSQEVKTDKASFFRFLESQSGMMETRLPDALKGQSARLIAVAKSHINGNYAAANSTGESIVQCVMEAAEFGFALDGKHCYAVPYKNGKTGKYEAKMMPGYIGMAAMARRIGVVHDVRAHVIMPGDEFDYRDESGTQISRYIPSLTTAENYDKSIGVYCVVDHKHGKRLAWMCRDDIEKRRAVSKASNKDSPWLKWPEEMAKKTLIRHELKTFSDDPAMIALFAADDAHNDLERLMSRPVNDGAFERLQASLRQPGDDIAEDAAENITDQTLFDRDAEFQAAAELEQQKEMAGRK